MTPDHLAKLNPKAVDAMDALFHFAKAMNENVSTADLANVMDVAVEDGFDLLEIQLSMAIMSIHVVRQRRKDKA